MKTLKSCWYSIVAFMAFFLTHYAVAQGLPQVPENVDWSIAKGPWGIAAVVIVMLVKGVNVFLPELAWKRSLVALLSAIYGIGATVMSSAPGNIPMALVTALFTMGGAVLIYESIKGIISGAKKVTS